MLRKYHIGALLGAAITCGTLFAAESSIGTAGANELRYPIGARGTALSGSFIGDATGVDAIFWNPGGIARTENNEASFGQYKLWADMTLYQMAVTHNFGGFGALGIGARIHNTGDLIVTTEEMPQGTGEIIEPTNSIVTFTWARNMTDRVSLGASVNMVHEKIKDVTANGYTLDFGVQVEMPYEGLSFGIALKNFGPDMKYEGYGGVENVHYDSDEHGAASRVTEPQFAPFEVPASFHFGLAYDAIEDPQNRWTLYSAFQHNNHSFNEIRLGSEYSYINTFFARAGYVQPLDVPDDIDYLHTWSAGVGFKIDLGASNLFIDWSYKPNENFDASQWYSLRFEF
jgi:hypothetical protein